MLFQAMVSDVDYAMAGYDSRGMVYAPRRRFSMSLLDAFFQPSHPLPHDSRRSILLDMPLTAAHSHLDTIAWAYTPITPVSAIPDTDALLVSQLDLHLMQEALMLQSCMLQPTMITPPPVDTPKTRRVQRKPPRRLPLPIVTQGLPSPAITAHTPSSTALLPTACPTPALDAITESLLESTPPSDSLPSPRAFYSHIPTTSTLPPPRPPNAFILYRKHQSQHLRTLFPGLHLRTVSRIVSKWWREASDAQRQDWRDLADAAKREHQSRWPGYKYKPKDKGVVTPVDSPQCAFTRGDDVTLAMLNELHAYLNTPPLLEEY